MSITAAMIKDLRERSGAGMMDCKKALVENDGDIEAAIDWLRTKGLAKAAKKSGRIASEGLIGLVVEGDRGAVVEVNSETDFVARNENFQEMVTTIAQLSLAADGDIDKLNGTTYPGSGNTVEQHLKEMVGTIGENMNLRRTASQNVSEGVIAGYVHNAITDGLGKIGVLVNLESSGDKDKLRAFGRQVAMHVAATNPLAATVDELDKDVVKKERAVLSEEARNSGKPENIIEKMVEGRIRKFYSEVVLLSQTFVVDGENTVEKAMKLAEEDVGAPIKLIGFTRYALGEGIEKKQEDFAAEVAAAAGS